MIFTRKDRAILSWIQDQMIRNEREYLQRKKLNDERIQRIENSILRLDAALKGTGDGLASEIGTLRKVLGDVGARQWIEGFRLGYKRGFAAKPKQKKRRR